MTPDQPQGKKTRRMLAFYIAMGVVLALVVGGWFSRTPLQVFYWKGQLKEFLSSTSKGGFISYDSSTDYPLTIARAGVKTESWGRLLELGPGAAPALGDILASATPAERSQLLGLLDGADQEWTLGIVAEYVESSEHNEAVEALCSAEGLARVRFFPQGTRIVSAYSRDGVVARLTKAEFEGARSKFRSWWKREGKAKYGRSQPGLRTRSVITRYMQPGGEPPDTVPLPGDVYDGAALRAVRTLGGNAEAIERLRLFRKMPSSIAPQSHKKRALCLLQHCGKDALPLLLAIMDGGSLEERKLLTANAKYDTIPEDMFEPIISRGLTDPDPEVSRSAATTVHITGRASSIPAEVVVRAIALGGSEVRIVCCRALDFKRAEAKALPEAVPALIRALEDDDPRAIADACYVLAMLGRHATAAIEDVSALLSSHDSKVRMNALAALQSMGTPWAPEPMHRAWPRYEVLPVKAKHAAGTLGAGGGRHGHLGDWPKTFGSGRAGKIAVPALLKALGHQSENTRYGALAVLGGIGSHAKKALPAIRQTLKDQSPEVRVNAVWAIWMIEGNCPQNELGALSVDKSEKVQLDAVQLLHLLKPQEPLFTRLVERALRSDFPAVRLKATELQRAAAEALKKIKAAQERKK